MSGFTVHGNGASGLDCKVVAQFESGSSGGGV